MFFLPWTTMVSRVQDHVGPLSTTAVEMTFFSTMDNHGRPCSEPCWTMVNHGSKSDILFYHGQPCSGPLIFMVIDG